MDLALLVAALVTPWWTTPRCCRTSWTSKAAVPILIALQVNSYSLFLILRKCPTLSVAVPNNGECQQEMASALQPCLQQGDVGITKEVCVMEVIMLNVALDSDSDLCCRNFWR